MGLRVCSPKKLVVSESLRFVNLGKEGWDYGKFCEQCLILDVTMV